MQELAFIENPPSLSGWYWVDDPVIRARYLLEVRVVHGVAWVVTDGSDLTDRALDLGVRWAGPVSTHC